MTKLKSINPSNKKVLGEVDVTSEGEVVKKVQEARNAKLMWKEIGVKKRVELLTKVYDALYERRGEIAKADSTEMGFPITQCRDYNLGDGFSFFKWNIENAEKILSPEVTYEDETSKSTVYYEPRGVLAVIQPWNFPFCQWSWGVVAGLLAGNTVVYKPSEEVPLSAILIEEIVNLCNLPKGVLNFVYGDGKVGEFLVNQDIDMIVFTGSTATGKKLYKIAADKFIPVQLELGGSAPGIVFEDVDINKTVDTVFDQRFINCGQACDGLKRLIVHKSIFNEVVEKLKNKLESSIIGDPLDNNTQFGPLAAERQLDLLESQVNDAIEKGAKVITGGERVHNLEGFYFKPTLLTNIKPEMRVWNEEVFGPVLPVIAFDTEVEAVKLANDTRYGLGAYVYSSDKTRARRIVGMVKAGNVSINGSNYVLPMNPFGGYKESGIGREHGKFGFHDLTQIKVVAEEK